MSNYIGASVQWSTRPADERFWSLAAMRASMSLERSRSKDYAIPADWLSVSDSGNGGNSNGTPSITITSPSGELIVRPTHHAMGQLCRLIGVPMDFLGSLSSELARQVVGEKLQQFAKGYGYRSNEENENSVESESDHDDNSSIDNRDDFDATLGNGSNREDSREMKLLISRNDTVMLRSVTTRSYGRIWNDDVIRQCERLIDQGWKVPPSRLSGNERDDQIRVATEEDVLKSAHHTLGVKVGQRIGPSLFGSDRDMFVTLVDDNRPVMNDNGNELYRSLVVMNSEVGNLRAFICDTMLFRSVCSNVIYWDISQFSRTKIVHKGRYAQRKALDSISALDVDSDNLSLSISAARNHIIGQTVDDVVKEVFGRKIASKQDTLSAFKLAEFDCDMTDSALSPYSIWGLSQGFTRLAQGQQYADKRDALNRVPMALLALAK